MKNLCLLQKMMAEAGIKMSYSLEKGEYYKSEEGESSTSSDLYSIIFDLDPEDELDYEYPQFNGCWARWAVFRGPYDEDVLEDIPEDGKEEAEKVLAVVRQWWTIAEAKKPEEMFPDYPSAIIAFRPEDKGLVAPYGFGEFYKGMSRRDIERRLEDTDTQACAQWLLDLGAGA